MHKRVLIVGTVPYNKMSSSRAFDAYFHYWEKENLAQIFSNTKHPCKGHCETVFQITDYRMLRRWFYKDQKTGLVFNYDDMDDESVCVDPETGSEVASGLYKAGKKHTATIKLLRGLIWRKKYWYTDELKEWLDAFNPECVFLSFSDDFFIPRIALQIARDYNIPIVSSIGDDYYFNTKKSISLAYHLYKYLYRRLIRSVFAHKGSAIYISDKIRDKYNSEFGLDGETVYLASEIKRRDFRPINTECPIITYCGNIGLGRNHSLCDIAGALLAINPDYRIHVFSNESLEERIKELKKHPGVIYGGSIPYREVMDWIFRSDVTVIVEGFMQEDIDIVRYSLSTKAADSLASGASIITYGAADCGVIEYMKSTGASVVCTEKSRLTDSIIELFQNQALQREYYEAARKISEEHHSLASSTRTFESVVNRCTQ